MIDFASLTDYPPRLFTAIAEWGACMIYIMILKKEWKGAKKWGICLSMLLVFMLYQVMAGALHLFFWIPGMCGAVLLMYFFLLKTIKGSWKDVGFCTIRAFVLAEFIASIQWQIYVWISLGSGKTSALLSVFLMIVIYALMGGIFFFIERGHFPESDQINVTGKEFLSAAVIGLSAFCISNLSFLMPDSVYFGAVSAMLYIRTLVDFGGLVTLVAQQERREELRMRGENQAMNIVLQRQYDQYRISIDNIELLRREFHDLKHYMVAIRSEKDPEKREQYLTEMEEAIHTQEAFINTGNNVLDVVLTTKSNYCSQKNITFNCMADGKLVSFLHVKDICSIFGNALDNAIECVSQFEDPEKRLIILSMFQKNQFLMIQFENYCDTPLKLGSNQLPSTTKENAAYHGYGLKSIRQAALKYNGTMNIHAEDCWFKLQVLIPVRE